MQEILELYHNNKLANDIEKELIKMIEEEQYIILPESIAINKVYKIHVCGDLEKDGYEVGYLVIPKGSGIKKHQHTKDIERYKLIEGTLSVMGEKTDNNICILNNFHNIDIVDKPTIIQTCKINKLNLFLVNNQSVEDFDTFVTNIMVSNAAKILNKCKEFM